MSQIDFDSNNPWAWTDKTIHQLMQELEKIREMVKKYPNNMELGKKIREWANADTE